APDGTRAPSGRAVRFLRWAAAGMVGPDPSAGEVAATMASAVLGTALAASAAATAGLPALAVAVAAVVAFDFFGGAAATATAAAKRRYHGPGTTPWRRVAFAAAHVQPYLLALCVPALEWWAAALIHLLAVAGACAVAAAPPVLRPPVAFAAAVLGSAAALLYLPVPEPLGWLAPVMLIKLLLAHMLPGAAPSEE